MGIAKRFQPEESGTVPVYVLRFFGIDPDQGNEKRPTGDEKKSEDRTGTTKKGNL